MNTPAPVKVWDPFIRIFHWSLVIAFFLAYFTDEKKLLDIHVYAGYIALGLVIFRILWGFIGAGHARFADFVFAPTVICRYTIDVTRGVTARYLGHNPTGGAMVLLLLAMLIITTVSGIAVYGADQHAGPMAGLFEGTGEKLEDLLEEVHEVSVNLTLVLIGFHVAGVIVESLLHKENLVTAMFTGRKRA